MQMLESMAEKLEAALAAEPCVPKSLIREQIDDYARNGVLFPVPVLSRREVRRFRAGYDELLAAFDHKPKSIELGVTHLHFRWAWELVTHAKVLDAVEDVLGPDLLVWSSSIFAKPARDPSHITFHQDGAYWGLDSTRVTTAWVALSPSTVESGCMRVVPGTQKDPIHPHEETWAEDNLLSRGQEVQANVADEDVVDVVLQPGEMSLHHVNIIHGSGRNVSDEPRVGFAIRYIDPQVRQVTPDHPVIVARGEDRYGHYEHMTAPPPETRTSEALAKHLVAAEIHAREILSTKPQASR